MQLPHTVPRHHVEAIFNGFPRSVSFQRVPCYYKLEDRHGTRAHVSSVTVSDRGNQATIAYWVFRDVSLPEDDVSVVGRTFSAAFTAFSGSGKSLRSSESVVWLDVFQDAARQDILSEIFRWMNQSHQAYHQSAQRQDVFFPVRRWSALVFSLSRRLMLSCFHAA